MAELVVCRRCTRHVRVTDAVCPFCHAKVAVVAVALALGAVTCRDREVAAIYGGPPPQDGGVSAPASAPSPSAASRPTGADDAVLETVFLHELRAAKVKPDESVCLRVRDAAGASGDASAGLLAAIQKAYPKAVAASLCAGGGPQPVTTKAAGSPAWMLDIGPVEWDGTDAARVGGGGASPGGHLGIREVEYRVVRESGAWRVAGEKVLRQN